MNCNSQQKSTGLGNQKISFLGIFFQKLEKNIYYLDRGMGPKYGPKLAIKKGLMQCCSQDARLRDSPLSPRNPPLFI